MRPTLGPLAAIAFVCLTGFAFASGRPPGSASGFDHPPSNDEIRGKLHDICTGLLTGDGKAAQIAGRRCSCYANGVVKAMTPGELDEMRATGKFSPSAQPKAKRFMASCRVNG